MVTVSVFKLAHIPKRLDILYNLTGVDLGKCKFEATRSRENDKEIEIVVTYEEDLETGMKRVFSDRAEKLANYLRENGEEKISRDILCYLNTVSGILEIYRGKDHITAKIKKFFEGLLKVRLEQVDLTSQQLLTIVNKNSEEVKKAMFKYIHGMWYQILRGKRLEKNQKYLEYISSNPNSLRLVSVIPKIDWVNGSKYTVTFDGERGTIKMYDGSYRGKPREEIKQFIDMMMNVRNTFPS